MDIKETKTVEITISDSEIEWLRIAIDKAVRSSNYKFSDEAMAMQFYQDLLDSLSY